MPAPLVAEDVARPSVRQRRAALLHPASSHATMPVVEQELATGGCYGADHRRDGHSARGHD